MSIRYRMDMSAPTRRRLSREDWARAALAAVAEGGTAAVAVEPLAVRLGTTKGSFYWHFGNRDELVAAAVELWERERTEDVIAAVEAEPEPRRRLRRLFSGATDTASRDKAELGLLVSAADPVVGPALRRVTARRIAYLTSQFEALGLSAEHAASRALLAYASYLGHAQLSQVAPGELPAGASARREYLDRSVAVLTAVQSQDP